MSGRNVGSHNVGKSNLAKPNLGKSNMSGRIVRQVGLGAAVVIVAVGTLVAENHKEYRFTVGPKAGLSVNNPYGSISVKPSTGSTVVIDSPASLSIIL